MKYTKILLIILPVLFFIVFFYVLITNNNKLIKFRVIKEPIEESIDNNINYDYLKNKYLIKTCKDMCKNNFCDEYQTQVIKYDLCKECKKENKCYDYSKGICVPCKNNYTCEQLHGCDKTPPINPINNFCTRCWLKN